MSWETTRGVDRYSGDDQQRADGIERHVGALRQDAIDREQAGERHRRSVTGAPHDAGLACRRSSDGMRGTGLAVGGMHRTGRRRRSDGNPAPRRPSDAPDNSSGAPAPTATPPGTTARRPQRNEDTVGGTSSERDRTPVYTDAEADGSRLSSPEPAGIAARSPRADCTTRARFTVRSPHRGGEYQDLAEWHDVDAVCSRRSRNAANGRRAAGNGWLHACGAVHLPVDSKQHA